MMGFASSVAGGADSVHGALVFAWPCAAALGMGQDSARHSGAAAWASLGSVVPPLCCSSSGMGALSFVRGA